MYRFIFFWALIWPLNAWADFAEGLAAYERGDGKIAHAEFRPLAQRGEAEAQYYLGRLYYYDIRGMRKDYRMSARWFHHAAKQGHSSAQYKLGGMYFSGRGVKTDDREAIKWWRLSGGQGHAEAQNNLGAMFANGRGVPQSLILAYALQTLAHANGNELAAENMRSKENIMSVAEIDTAKKLAHKMNQPGMFSITLDNYIHTMNP